MSSDKKIRVLAVCHESPDLILGGMGMHIRELYRHMALRDDVEIDLLTSGPGEGDRLYDGYNYRNSHKLLPWKPNTPDVPSMLVCDLQLEKTLLRLAYEGHKWDVVHIHEWPSLQLGWQVRDAFNIPLVSTMHLCITRLMDVEGADITSSPLPELTKYLMNQECRLVGDSDALILCSDAYRSAVKETFFLERHIDVIHNGIDTAVWHPSAGDASRARSVFNIPNDRPVALFVGRIATMKGIIQILDLVEREDTGFRIVLCGEVNTHSEKEKENWFVTKRIRELQERFSERLMWVGFQKDDDLRDLYACATVGLMPSTHEPFGLVSLEHMAMGNPLICTEVDGLGEIVIDDNGNEYAMICRQDNVDDISSGLKMLHDVCNREKLRELGLKRAHDFDWNVAVTKTVDIYHRVIDKSI